MTIAAAALYTGAMPTILFSSSPWLQPRTSSVVQRLCETHGKTITARKNTQLLDAGFKARDIYLLVDGACRFVYHDRDGAETTLSLLLPGRSIGDFSIAVDRRIMFNLEVLQDSSFKVVGKKLLLDHLDRHPQDREKIDENVKERYRSYLEGFYSNATLNMERRLAKFFENLIGEPEVTVCEDRMSLPAFLTQALIASILATNNVTIHKILQKWKREERLLYQDGLYWVNLSRLIRHKNPFADTTSFF